MSSPTGSFLSDPASDLDLEGIAAVMGMSTRWVRGQLKANPDIAFQKYGHKIRFTPTQVEAFKARFTQGEPAPRSITTGRKRAS